MTAYGQVNGRLVPLRPGVHRFIGDARELHMLEQLAEGQPPTDHDVHAFFDAHANLLFASEALMQESAGAYRRNGTPTRESELVETIRTYRAERGEQFSAEREAERFRVYADRVFGWDAGNGAPRDDGVARELRALVSFFLDAERAYARRNGQHRSALTS